MKNDVKLIVKVDPEGLQKTTSGACNESFAEGGAKWASSKKCSPGSGTGPSAGLVEVTLPNAPGAKARRATLKALRNDKAISYVNTPKTRRLS